MNAAKQNFLFYLKTLIFSLIICCQSNAASNSIDISNAQENDLSGQQIPRRAPQIRPHTIQRPQQPSASDASAHTSEVTPAHQTPQRAPRPTQRDPHTVRPPVRTERTKHTTQELVSSRHDRKIYDEGPRERITPPQNIPLQTKPENNQLTNQLATPAKQEILTEKETKKDEPLEQPKTIDTKNNEKEDKKETPNQNNEIKEKDEPKKTDVPSTPSSESTTSKEPQTQVTENKQETSEQKKEESKEDKNKEDKKEDASTNQTENNEQPAPTPTPTTPTDAGSSEKGGSSSTGMFTAAGMTALVTGIGVKMALTRAIDKSGKELGNAGGSIKENLTGNLKQQKEFRKNAQQNIAVQEKLITDRHSQAKRKVRFYALEAKKGTPGAAEKLEKWKTNLQKAENLRNDISAQKGLLTKNPSKHLTAEAKHTNDLAHIKLSKNVMSEEKNRLQARLNKYDQKEKLTSQQLIKQKDARKRLDDIQKNTYSDDIIKQKEKQVKVLKKQNVIIKKARRINPPKNPFSRRKV